MFPQSCGSEQCANIEELRVALNHADCSLVPRYIRHRDPGLRAKLEAV